MASFASASATQHARAHGPITRGPRPHPSESKENPARRRIYLGARSLASLNLPGACPACFYLQMQCRREMPFQIGFPSLLYATDRQVKRAVHRALDETGKLPPWMPVLGRVRGYIPDLSYTWYRYLDAKTNISVSGVPDDLFVMADGSIHIVDYKTAFLTKKQREIMPLYEAQLAIYAYIGRRLVVPSWADAAGGSVGGPMGPLWGRTLPGHPQDLTLIYLEPSEPEDERVLRERRLRIEFRAKAVPVVNEAEELVPALLERARSIMDDPPTPKHIEGCEELKRMDRLMEAQTGDPFVATLGRYHEGICMLCGEGHLLAAGHQICFLCLEMENW